MSYLVQYADPGLAVRDDETVESLAAAEVQRLVELHAVAVQAQRVPRRVGEGAGDEDLARDKRRSRRIAYFAGKLLKDWGGTLPAEPNGYGREAAQVRWEVWWANHETFLVNRRRYIATWALRGGDDRWAKSAIVRLNNELNWMAYALRD